MEKIIIITTPSCSKCDILKKELKKKYSDWEERFDFVNPKDEERFYGLIKQYDLHDAPSVIKDNQIMKNYEDLLL